MLYFTFCRCSSLYDDVPGPLWDCNYRPDYYHTEEGEAMTMRYFKQAAGEC